MQSQISSLNQRENIISVQNRVFFYIKYILGESNALAQIIRSPCVNKFALVEDVENMSLHHKYNVIIIYDFFNVVEK